MTSRRTFLINSGTLAAGAALVPFFIGSANGRGSANDKIGVALVGCKSMGWYDLTDHLKVPNVVCIALCDVDQNILNAKSAEVAKLTGTTPKLFGDYRKVLDDKDVQVVIIGTPDHWHCKIAVEAMEAGKDVYVEKPLANSIAECEVMYAAAKKYKRVVQVGQQQRSGQHWQDCVATVQSGKLGVIRKVKTWANFDYARGSAKVPDSAVPDGVDYDQWLGPSPKTAFNKNRFHGSWRMFWNQGGGLQTDWGVHLLDLPLWAMKVSTPKSINSVGGIYDSPGSFIETPDTQTSVFDFGNFLLEWEQGAGLNKGIYGRNYGVAFVGTNGTLVINREGWEIIPETNGDKPRMEVVALQPADKHDHIKHVQNFVECLTTRKAAACDIEFGCNSAVLAHMANVSFRTGNKLFWNEPGRNFGNDQQANAYLKPEYRKGFAFPKV